MKKITNSKKMIILIILLLLTGCGKKQNPEVVLCNRIESKIKEYNASKLSFEEFFSKIETEYNELCIDNENRTCTSIKSMQTFNNQKHEIKDCSIYKEGTLKNVCEQSNKLIKDSINQKEQVEKAYVSELEYSCKLAKE